METLEVVCEHTNTPLGVSIDRKTVIEKHLWCRSTNVYILNSAGEILCHQRSKEKERNPGFWCTHVGGHVGAGESYELNAVKELEEEAGVKVPAHQVIPWRITKLPTARLWVKEFVAVIDKPVEEFTPQVGEVDRFEWKRVEQIIHEQRNNTQPWLAGTHDLYADYQCLRAVVTATSSAGILSVERVFHTWHPPVALA